MMSMAADGQAKKDTPATAHSPLERRLSFRTFASQQ